MNKIALLAFLLVASWAQALGVNDPTADVSPGAVSAAAYPVPGQFHVNANAGAGAACSATSPCATINAAVTAAANYNAVNPSIIAEIVIAPGTYAETITLNDANLRKLYIRAALQQNFTRTPTTDDPVENYETPVQATALQSTGYNESLRYLAVEGIHFTGASELSATTTGNHFLIDKGVLKGCVFDSTLTVASAAKVFLENSYFASGLTANNIAAIYTYDSVFLGTVAVDWNGAGILPQRYDGANATSTNIVIPKGEVQALGNWELTNSAGAVVLYTYGWFYPYTLDLGSGTYLFLKPGGGMASITADAETWASGSSIYAAGGSYVEKATRTNNATLTYFEVPPDMLEQTKYVNSDVTSAANTDINTGTETVDSFADTEARGAVWQFAAYKGANSRTGTMMATWDPTGDTVAYTETVTSDVGVTTDLTMVVDISSNNVRLRATAASNDWIVTAHRARF